MNLSEIKNLKFGTTVYSVFRKTSRTGLSDWYDFYILQDEKPINIGKIIANHLGLPFEESGVKTDSRPATLVIYFSETIFHNQYHLKHQNL
jgi:hypothetical protein